MLSKQSGNSTRSSKRHVSCNTSDAVRVCRDIARSIEQQLDYPGEIKVTVIRETRGVDTAK